MEKPTNVEEYISRYPKWEREIQTLRKLLNSFELSETIKWGTPVYTLEGNNVVEIAAFKKHMALWFYQGALLKENTSLLHNAQEGKTKALRQIRFEEDQEINPDLLRNYIKEAVRNQREGKKVKVKAVKELVIPQELKEALKMDENLGSAFHKLSPGRQREYSTYIEEAKKAETKKKRLEKILPMIADGKGLNDKYR